MVITAIFIAPYFANQMFAQLLVTDVSPPETINEMVMIERDVSSWIYSDEVVLEKEVELNINITDELESLALYSDEVIIETLTWSWDEWYEEENNITIHIWVEDWDTIIFGHWDAWEPITLISKFGLTCSTYINSKKAYKCSVWEFQDINLDEVRVKYFVDPMEGDLDMYDLDMMEGEF